MTRRHVPALLGLLLAVSGCGGAAAGDDGGHAGSTRPDGRLVLVSGRDDHGQLAQRTLPVYDGPGSRDRVGRIADGTLAHVREIDGTWLHLVTAEGEAVEGWIDDFHLRGTLHLVGPPPSCHTFLAGRPAPLGLQVVVAGIRGGRVLVSSVADPGLRGWVDRGAVQELPPRGDGCAGEPEADAGHGH